MWHNINFHQLVVQLLPTFLRKPIQIAFLLLFSNELMEVYSAWKDKRNRDLDWLNHTSQVFSLEHILNQEFDSFDNRIKIIDGELYEPNYVFTLNENQPLHLFRLTESTPIDVQEVFIHQNDDYEGGVDFYVGLPLTMNVSALTIQITVLVNRYKLASKRFKIVNYE